MKKKYLIVIPTYNEKKNVKTILKNIRKKCKFMYEILFVDDNSTDGTKEILRNLRNKRLTVINREKKLGVGSAHKVGISYGYKKKFDFIITMDCDGTHNPKYINKIIKLAKKNDLVTTNRFIMKNSLLDWDLHRKYLTTIRHLFVKFMFNINLDSSGAFRCYSTKKIKLDDILQSKNDSYSFFTESIILLSLKKYKIAEIPVLLPKRFSGSSKMRLADVCYGFFYTIFIFLKKRLINF